MAAIGVDEADADALLALRAEGVSVVIDATAGRLPSIVHWGAALPAMDADQAAALVAAAVPVIASNNADVPPRLAVLPEHHTGWTGRPGLAGSRGGRQWSPAFRVTSVLVDGAPVRGYADLGAASVEFGAD
ncbi:MAG: alpha-galactosidase, partial [Pseudonocardiales bacterium]|nr:alpha-galactosidase [Pseudonocardiales bacterium]